MSNTIIKLENISKQYRLGTVGTQTLKGDLQRWWYRIAGKEDPTLKIGQTNQLNQASNHQSSITNRQSDNYVWALRDINLEVKQGEVLGIIGKNGAGKSTLLKLLSRVTGPTTGQIKVKGRIASLLEVGTGFHPELTGKENIFLNGAILGMNKPEIRAKFDEIVDFAGVAKYIDTPVKRYSSGMYVRLAFAVAAHLEPDILVVDEVLAVGDAEFQKKAIGKMQDVSTKGGRTVLFVSHNMASVQKLCSSTVVLQNGRIDYIGETRSAIDKYLNNYKEDNKSHISISKITERRGSGNVKIEDITINDQKGKFEHNFVAGQKLVFKIKYCSTFDGTIKDFNIGLGIYNKAKEFVTVVNSKMSQNDFLNLPANGTVFCEIPKLPLTSGEFFITATLKVNNQLSDQIENIKKLIIEPGDYYGTGNSNISYNRQGVYINQKWYAKSIN